ncbi:hypothetical protein L596_013699 [Steinernema carpocapsae]|uniref:F-box domain-containing protein n=1 Tax=Steinernema carpocapsae TaxID=34508 RepID=A0A4U5P0Z7_STECR|nr:hypothetical protein L596_013699 [Steinernema carpocapsae]
MSFSKLSEGAWLEIAKNLSFEDNLKLRLVSSYLNDIALTNIKHQQLAPVKIAIYKDRHVFYCGQNKLHAIYKKIRRQDQIDEEEYFGGPIGTTDAIIIGQKFNPSEECFADAVKVLKLRRSHWITSITLKFRRRHVSHYLSEVLELLATKPLKTLVLEWLPEEGFVGQLSDEDLSRDIAVFDALFRALRGTLTKVLITGPFSLSEVIGWFNNPAIEHVYFKPIDAERVALGQNTINMLVQDLKKEPRKCHFDIDPTMLQNDAVWEEIESRVQLNRQQIEFDEDLWDLQIFISSLGHIIFGNFGIQHIVVDCF